MPPAKDATLIDAALANWAEPVRAGRGLDDCQARGLLSLALSLRRRLAAAEAERDRCRETMGAYVAAAGNFTDESWDAYFERRDAAFEAMRAALAPRGGTGENDNRG